MTENVPAATGTEMTTASGGNQSVSAPVNSGAAMATERSDLMEKEDSGVSRLHPLVVGFNKLTMMRQFGLLIGLAASIALGLGVVLWSQKDTYRPLMNSTNSYDARE
ncbi:MAG: hypothetical protein R3309_10915, partial [Reinekea sp.]|nr:hypothetical protein [Reinekea sp.]